VQEQFALLLSCFTTLVAKSSPVDLPTDHFRKLLEQFRTHRERAVAEAQSKSTADHNSFDALLKGYNETVDRYRKQQELSADDFNLLDVMRLTGKEIRHSMVLAWLLDHDLRRLGTHAQGSLGFQLFLAEFSLPLSYANCNYWVRREVAGNESIVDVEIACRGQFLIHIENKIWSSEGNDQTNREWNDLQRRARDLKVGSQDVHAFFLTPSGKKPENPYFHTIGWGRIVSVLEAFADHAQPSDVKLFAAHYARAVRRSIVGSLTCEEEDGEITDERGRAISS